VRARIRLYTIIVLRALVALAAMAPKRRAASALAPATPTKRRAAAPKAAASAAPTPTKAPPPAEAAAAVAALVASAPASAPAWAGPGLAHCAAADGGRLGEIVARCGFPDYLAKDVADDSACAALCRIIVGQQLAGAAAAKIWARTLAALCPRGFAAAAVAAAAGGAAELPDDLRQACGLSRAKAKAVVGVARAFLAGDLSDELLATAPVDELRSRLCALNGVGPWSCDMYLIFHLKKADVLPLGDLGVRAGAARAFGVRGRGKNGALDMKKDADVLEALFAPYAPYRSLAAYYMWRVVDTKAFNQDADA
jgi:DNA-3-methyladenine glycosylase II